MAVKERTRVDIERQRVQDARRAMSEQLLKVRYHAVLEAYDEVIANAEDPDAPPNQEGAVWALRQGLVDHGLLLRGAHRRDARPPPPAKRRSERD
jgi:hypothetical protein